MTLEETIAHHRWAAENCEGEVRDEHSQMVDWLEELRRLKAENAKLRELVKNMHGWLVVNYEKFYVIPLNGLNNIERDMRELGIEVADD